MSSVYQNEALKGVVYYHGEPSYTFNNRPVWLLTENSGFIFTGGELRPFTVSLEDKIFDVYNEQQYVDYGEDYFNAYLGYKFDEAIITDGKMPREPFITPARVHFLKEHGVFFALGALTIPIIVLCLYVVGCFIFAEVLPFEKVGNLFGFTAFRVYAVIGFTLAFIYNRTDYKPLEKK